MLSSICIFTFSIISGIWSSANGEVPYNVEFTDSDISGNEAAREEVASKGLFASNAAKGKLSKSKIDLSLDTHRGLAIHLKKRSAFGWTPFTFSTARNDKDTRLLVPEGADLLEISWGVDMYPEGWNPGQIRHAIQVILEFSTEDGRRGSGMIGAPRADNFPAFSLCEFGSNYRSGSDRADWFWIGKMYKKQGRYACVGEPGPGEVLNTRIDLAEAYAAAFDDEWEEARPSIVSVGIAAYNYGVGPSAAYIRSISLKQK